MPPIFRRVDWGYRNMEAFVFQSNEIYRLRTGEDMNNDQLEWMQIIYEEYADSNGDISWTHSRDNEAWYYYMTEVLDIPDDRIDRYTDD